MVHSCEPLQTLTLPIVFQSGQTCTSELANVVFLVLLFVFIWLL